MSSPLRLRTTIKLAPEGPGDFDHGDVDPETCRVFVAHTSAGTVDVIDGESLEFVKSIDGCPEGSGVLCAPSERLVLAAARGAGKVLLIDADRLDVVGEAAVGPKPNGLAWDPGRGRALVADVDASDQKARFMDLKTRSVVAETELPGRPRWAVFDATLDAYLVNVREPASVTSLAGSSGRIQASWPISSAGPHGLDLDRRGRRAFVACDGAHLIALDLSTGREVGSVSISGVPDATWFNPKNHRVYVAVGSPGVVDVIDSRTLRMLDSIKTGPGAKTTALDVDRGRLYVFLPESSAAAVYEET